VRSNASRKRGNKAIEAKTGKPGNHANTSLGLVFSIVAIALANRKVTEALVGCSEGDSQHLEEHISLDIFTSILMT
jgi:hypothetical protein